MSNHPIQGHHTARRQLASAIAKGSLPQVIALVGPEGVGKQRLGLWLAQLLFCERPGGEPCGSCKGCLQTLNLAHPDLHWLAPVPRPKAADADKQVEEIAEAQAELIAERRAKPFYGLPGGLEGHFVATARLIIRRAALTPAVGRWKVFIIGFADRLVPQESSAEAANALLKLLEEPPADTIIVLTTTDLNALLPTIRSRSIPLRVGRLTDMEVADFVRAHAEPSPSAAQLAERVRDAQGSIGAAMIEGGGSDGARENAHRLIEAVMAGPVARAERGFRQPGFAARGEFTAMLDALGETLAEAARTSAGLPERVALPRGLAGNSRLPALNRASSQVAEAREAAQGNVNPQLLLTVLLDDLADTLCA